MQQAKILILVRLLQESRCAYAVLIMAVYWVTEAVPIAATAFLPVILLPLMGVMTASDVSKAYISVSAECRISCP